MLPTSSRPTVRGQYALGRVALFSHCTLTLKADLIMMTLTRVDNSNSRAYSPHWRHNILGNYTMSVSSESLTT